LIFIEFFHDLLPIDIFLGLADHGTLAASELASLHVLGCLQVWEGTAFKVAFLCIKTPVDSLQFEVVILTFAEFVHLLL
jgi:hypothetical protein